KLATLRPPTRPDPTLQAGIELRCRRTEICFDDLDSDSFHAPARRSTDIFLSLLVKGALNLGLGLTLPHN
ncbi:hypothetical protein PILCRDRAFT_818583, partial [Piloderma croceum F 1598]